MFRFLYPHVSSLWKLSKSGFPFFFKLSNCMELKTAAKSISQKDKEKNETELYLKTCSIPLRMSSNLMLFPWSEWIFLEGWQKSQMIFIEMSACAFLYVKGYKIAQIIYYSSVEACMGKLLWTVLWYGCIKLAISRCVMWLPVMSIWF